MKELALAFLIAVGGALVWAADTLWKGFIYGLGFWYAMAIVASFAKGH